MVHQQALQEADVKDCKDCKGPEAQPQNKVVRSRYNNICTLFLPTDDFFQLVHV